MLPVGLWSRAGAGEGGGSWRKERRTKTGDRTRQVIMCAPSHSPFQAILHPCSVSAQGPSGEQAACWWTGLRNPDYTTLTSAGLNTIPFHISRWYYGYDCIICLYLIISNLTPELNKPKPVPNIPSEMVKNNQSCICNSCISLQRDNTASVLLGLH